MSPEFHLLIADRLRRTNRWVVLFIAAFAGGAWWAGPHFEPTGRAMTTSMGIALIAGPQVALWHLPRYLWYLPVSRRDIWRANWLVSTIAVTLLTTVAKLLALLAPASEAGSLPLGSVALSALFDFGATGLGCALIIVATFPRPSRRAWHSLWAIGKGAAEFTLPVIGMALFYVPAWAGLVPPGRWSGLTPGSGALLAALVALAIATWFHVPTPLTPASRLAQPQTTAKPAPRAVQASRLTGIPRLLVREAGWTFAISGALAFGGGLIVLILAGVGQDQAYLAQFLQDALRVADGGHVSARDAGLVAFNLLVWYSVFTATLAARFPLMLRHLRVLPISAARLNGFILAWPALIWLAAWAVASVLHVVVLGHPPVRPHAPSVVALVGLSMLAQAASLRLNTPARIMNFAAFAGLLPFAGLISPPSPAVLVVFGIVAMATAAVLNRMALATSATYRIRLGALFGAAPDPR